MSQTVLDDISRSRAPVRKRSRFGDVLFRRSSLGVAAGLIALLGLMVWVLAQNGDHVLAHFGIHFFTGRSWNPVTETYGALPFIFGTLVTSAIAIVLAVPVSVALALLINEVRLGWLRNPLTVLVDLLAAIPSVVYGLWGLFIMVPWFDHTVEPFLAETVGRIPLLGALFRGNPNGGDLLSAGVILAVMILPIVTAITREIIAIVPNELREAALALGATRYEMIRMSVLPYARGGIVGATMLGLGRALGETIAVAMVVGNGLGLGASLLRPGYTIPAVIANEFREASSIGFHRSALLALALTLMAIALVLAAMSRLLVGRTAKLLAGGGTAEGAAAPSAPAVSG